MSPCPTIPARVPRVTDPGEGTQPFIPYGRQDVDEEDIAAVVAVLRSDFLTTGPAVSGFEAALAKRVGAKYAVAVSSGTFALHAAYFAAGVGPGDEVLVPAMTFVATANAARYLDANPRFVDVAASTGLMTTSSLEAVSSDKLKVVAPVHLNGMPVDMQQIAAWARPRGIKIVEDAAHALGADYQGQPVGSCEHSDMAIFSFHPVKHLTTGEGGAIVTNDEKLFRQLQLFRNHGMTREDSELLSESPGPWYYEQQLLGHNGRLSDIQAALGITQLAKLDGYVAQRRALAAHYDQALVSLAAVTPVPGNSSAASSAYHLYALQIDFAGCGVSRKTVMGRLRDRGIGSQVHYIPVPQQPYYQRLGQQPEDYPGAQQYYAGALSLPLFPRMTEANVGRVTDALRSALGDC